MVNIKNLSKNLHLSSDGIWVSPNCNDISFPEDFRQYKFEIEDHSFWFKHRNQCICHVINQFCSSNVFFDIGGGNGYVALAIQQMGLETVLIEPGIEGVYNARKRGVRYIVNSTLSDAGFIKKSMPAIGLFDVLEHVKDDVAVLKQIHHCLTEDGKLFLTVPAHNVLWSAVDEVSGHYRRYNRSQLQDLFNKTGFQIISFTYFFSFLIFPVFFLRTLPSKIKIRKPENKDVTRREDTTSPGFEKLLKISMNWEISRISRSLIIPFGTSCLCVAAKY
jgi:SAM-dependent methyltransferase|tara:strand:- start:928 stop:1755 length:828 start_codon:yes stop_codon:yes gene_type:complete